MFENNNFIVDDFFSLKLSTGRSNRERSRWHKMTANIYVQPQHIFMNVLYRLCEVVCVSMWIEKPRSHEIGHCLHICDICTIYSLDSRSGYKSGLFSTDNSVSSKIGPTKYYLLKNLVAVSCHIESQGLYRLANGDAGETIAYLDTIKMRINICDCYATE